MIEEKNISVTALISMILGIFSLLTFLILPTAFLENINIEWAGLVLSIFALVFGILAIILGAIALVDIRKNNKNGKRMAFVGIVIGSIVLIIFIIIILILLRLS